MGKAGTDKGEGEEGGGGKKEEQVRRYIRAIQNGFTKTKKGTRERERERGFG